jgi:hypothetical protein
MAMKRIFLTATALFLLAGCTVNSTFVYKPSATVTSVKTLPMRLAVLPFSDGTGNYTVRGSVLTPKNCTFNLAKAGIDGRINALTPELWAKAFADDLAASGTYRSVRFISSLSELSDEDFYVEGTLKSVDSGLLNVQGLNRFALVLRALRRTNREPVWEKEVAREWEFPEALFVGCGVHRHGQCGTDRIHADTNRAMQALFSEASVDLARTLESLLRSRDGVEPPALPKPTAAPESVDKTIEGILKGQ